MTWRNQAANGANSRSYADEKRERFRRPVTLALVAVLLLIPPLLLIVAYSGRRPPPQPAGPGIQAGIESPSFRQTGDTNEPPFGGLREPKDAAVDSLGRIWIADFGSSHLRLFDRTGAYLGGWGGKGDGTYGFRDLCGVSVRGEDLYIADTWNGRVECFTTSGQWKATAAGLSSPRGVAAAADGTVWVSDTGNHRVIAFDPNLQNPRTFGKKGSGPGEFMFPIGIGIDAFGNVFVADCGNRRVVLLATDGRFKTDWPVPGWEPFGDSYLEADADGSLYVTDPGKSQALLRFDRMGHLVERRTSDDEGRAFSNPSGLALDPRNRVLYVVNSGANTVSRIKLPEIRKSSMDSAGRRKSSSSPDGRPNGQ